MLDQANVSLSSLSISLCVWLNMQDVLNPNIAFDSLQPIAKSWIRCWHELSLSLSLALSCTFVYFLRLFFHLSLSLSRLCGSLLFLTHSKSSDIHTQKRNKERDDLKLHRVIHFASSVDPSVVLLLLIHSFFHSLEWPNFVLELFSFTLFSSLFSLLSSPSSLLSSHLRSVIFHPPALHIDCSGCKYTLIGNLVDSLLTVYRLTGERERSKFDEKWSSMHEMPHECTFIILSHSKRERERMIKKSLTYQMASVTRERRSEGRSWKSNSCKNYTCEWSVIMSLLLFKCAYKPITHVPGNTAREHL